MSLYLHMLAMTEIPVSHKNVLEEAMEWLILLISTLKNQFLIIFYLERWKNTESSFAAHRRRKIISRENTTWWFQLWAELATFFTKQHFYLEEELENYNYPDLDISQTFSQQWTRWACWFKKSTWKSFFAIDWSFQTKFKLKNKHLCPLHWAWKPPNN